MHELHFIYLAFKLDYMTHMLYAKTISWYLYKPLIFSAYEWSRINKSSTRFIIFRVTFSVCLHTSGLLPMYGNLWFIHLRKKTNI